MTEDNEEAPKSVRRRGLVGEAVLLAVSPVAAYVVAFAFEAGYADRMGYPSWAIHIEPANC